MISLKITERKNGTQEKNTYIVYDSLSEFLTKVFCEQQFSVFFDLESFKDSYQDVDEDFDISDHLAIAADCDFTKEFILVDQANGHMTIKNLYNFNLDDMNYSIIIK
jgi:hypothetical protein